MTVPAFVSSLVEWIRAHPGLTSGAVVLSIVTFVAGLALLPFVVRALPADYFVGDETPRPHWAASRPVLWRVVHAIKNLAGALLFALGVLMLVLPGQGLLTMFAGLLLMDLPRKRALEQRIVALPRVHRALDWIRARGGRAPLVLPGDGDDLGDDDQDDEQER